MLVQNQISKFYKFSDKKYFRYEYKMNQFDGYECKKMYYLNELFRFWFHNRYNLDTYSLNQPIGKQWRNQVGRRHWVVYYTSPQ